MTFYSVLRIIAVVFIVSGVALGLLSIYIFKSKNLAEAYDAIYNRGYVERAENRRRAKERRRKRETEVEIQKLSEESRAKNLAANSGNTAVLESNLAAKSGETSVLNSSVPANSGETSVLNNDSLETGRVMNEDFIITKELSYVYSKQTI